MPAAPPVVTVTVARPAKPWYTSRTLWLNVLALMLLVVPAGLIIDQPDLGTALLACLVDTLDSGDQAFEADPSHPLSRELRAASEMRAARGFTPAESLQYLQTCKEAVLCGLSANVPAQSQQAPTALRERLESVMDRCVQVLGGQGVTGETVVARIFADIRGFRIYDGPSEVHR